MSNILLLLGIRKIRTGIHFSINERDDCFTNRPLGLGTHGHAAKKTINKKYEELGPITFHETAVLGLFISMVLLWMFRDPHFMKGWSHIFHYGSM